MSKSYVHGYSETESQRLFDQADTLTSLIHHDSFFPPGSRILEAGCGTGAQTCILAKQNPNSHFISVDVSESSLNEAKKRISEIGLSNVTFVHHDIMDTDFSYGMFDHAVFCFVLEHLKEPENAILRVMKMVKPGGTITAIEGDHGSVCFHPETKMAMRTIECQVILQERAGGDACIGRKLYPILVRSGLKDVRVSPRIVYADGGRPEMIDGFTLRTFIAMIKGVKEQALAAGLMTTAEWEEGINDLSRSSENNGTFSYTFYKGLGYIP